MEDQSKIRNIAIIAHVDHGKTTLVDAFLKQSHLFRDNQDEMSQEMILDTGDLEKEKGITIKAKNIAVTYNDYKINIVDTPGHADFGGEVERTLNMANGCLLIIDAQEGVMPQTKFVLRKALEMGLRPILVINKIDKAFATPEKALNEASDLFLTLATDEAQLDFPVFYAVGREGKAWKQLPQKGANGDYSDVAGDITPLLEAIVEYIPAPVGDVNGDLQMQICTLEYDSYQGRMLIGRVNRGKAKVGDSITIISGQEENPKKESGKIKNLYVRSGLEFVPVDSVIAGDICAVLGVESVAIGGTLCISSHVEALPKIKISDPTVRIKFEANTSPLVGKEGKFVTAKQLQQRLDKEAEINISLKITKGDGGAYYVSGRGELQLSILIETLRREGFEFQIRRPEVLLKEIDGKKFEPLEEVVIDVPTEYQGTVTSALAERRGEMQDLKLENGQARFTYKILTRNLLGLRNILLTQTKGNLVMNNFIIDNVPYTHQDEIYRRGVLVSTDPGVAMGYSLNTIQERGELFTEPGTPVYQGMIIGMNKFDADLDVNPVKERQKSAVRMKHDEITQTTLKSIKALTLEFALVFMRDDELLEVTPKSLRLRKLYLTKNERSWSKRSNLTDIAKKSMGQS
ncbi:MAG: GTP-binding protein [Candidatus Dojkabacteria bacterium]